MILRRILAAVALLCAIVTTAHAQIGTPKTAAQLNGEINSLFADQNSQAITPFDLRQVTLDQVASGILGAITLSGDVSGSGINTILTSIGATAVHSSMLNADVFSTARSWSGLQTFSGGITGLPAPVNPSDAATKQYVDGAATGLIILAPSLLATVAVLPNTPTYSNGSLGVGATLTAGSNSTLTVDGTAAPLNTVVLVKNQVNAFQNGIYSVTTAGSGSAAWVLTRVTYFDQAAEMKVGSYTFISGGVTNLNSSWTLAATVTTVGTDPLNWTQFSSTGGVSNVAGFTGAVSAAQLTSACNIFTASLSGCVPSATGATSISQLNPSTNSWTTPASVVLQSRATAVSLNLTGVNVVQTQGYAAAGDGGGATFKNVGSAPFVDSFIVSGSLTAGGSGYPNGTYTGVPLTGGSGSAAFANIVVSGGAVTSATITGTGGNGYAVGDVLSASNIFLGGAGSGFTWTVGAITAPLGSFTDAVGTHFQIVVDHGNYINTRQFGAVINWTGNDATATNDFSAIQATLFFASAITSPSPDAGGTEGQTVVQPHGSSLICGGSATLLVPNGVKFTGQNGWASTLKVCDSGMNAATHIVTLCDPLTQKACFATEIAEMTIFETSTPAANGNVAVIFSNNVQQMDAVSRVSVYSGRRACLFFTTGFGGASYVGVDQFVCTPNALSANFGVAINYGLARLTNSIIESSGASINGLQAGVGGFMDVVNLHCEGISTCVFWNSSALTNSTLRIHNIFGGNSCTNLITRQGGSVAGGLIVGFAQPNGCTNTVNNGGSPVTGVIIGDTAF